MERVKTLWGYKNKNWRDIPILESAEELVLLDEKISHPYYALEMGMSKNYSIYLRETVVRKLEIARSILKRDGYDLKVYDGWRSMELQENLFWYYMKEFLLPKYSQIFPKFVSSKTPQAIKMVFDTLSKDLQENLKEANKTYVSWPTPNPKCPSPHSTGGAVDVWLYQNGLPVNLGVPFDWMDENAGAFYHLKIKRNKFPGDASVCRNRNTLLYAMIKAGFSCYGPEIWHFNYGNQMHSLVTGEDAVYSYIEP